MTAGGARSNSGPQPKWYDWAMLQDDYDRNHLSIKDLKNKYNMKTEVFIKAQERGDFKKRLSKIERIISGSGETCGRGDLKKHLIKKGILKNECFECGQKPEWNGKILVLVLDHKNGINNDDRTENVRLLCPNCNSQTSTFCGRNTKRNRSSTPVIQLVRIPYFDSDNCGSNPYRGATTATVR